MLVVAAVALLVYLRTLAPTITWAHYGADGGDLITAAVTRGVPHPTGYPTYLLLGRLFLLLPWGDPARRLNLMSAVFAALTVALLHLIVITTFRLYRDRQITWRERLVAAAGALIFAFSPLLWSQAVITEVYTLNAFFAALTTYLVLRWAERGRHWLLALAILVLGLGLGNHLTLSLLAPAVLLLTWSRRASLRSVSPWHLFALPLLFLLGLSVYLLLPLRASHRPAVNWGDPRTVAGFRWLVSGRLYRNYLFSLPLRYLPARLSAWVTLLIRQFGWWGVSLGLVGAWSLWRAARRAALFFAVTLLGFSVYAIGYDTSDSQVYLIPAFLAFAVWLSWGLAFLVEEAQRRIAPSTSRLLRALPLGLVLLLPLIPLATHAAAMDLSADDQAHNYSLDALDSVAPEAIVVSQTDAHTFSLWYRRYAQGRRNDVAILDDGLLHHAWYRRNTAQLHPRIALGAPPTGASGETSPASSFSLGSFIAENLERYPIYLTDPDAQTHSRYTLSPEGPVYRVLGQKGD